MGEEIKSTMLWCEITKERDHSDDAGVDGRMGLEWILRRLAVELTRFGWLSIGTVDGLL
jgi:hypothetical protein